MNNRYGNKYFRYKGEGINQLSKQFSKAFRNHYLSVEPAIKNP